ncbi:hypothetical protein SCHPADRAFT_260961 [Schizopora paradoxa]|uniref:RING-type domain-containing protein n=1 Tax=Schizopora paradoxa TaxID=27342 RepID=A0A0H2SES5_9AGAM|nr:hypothetical protein SCHPADRAFT_260961 [Schizopora paradoxa]
MAKMRNPPFQATDDVPEGAVNNGAGPSNSKRKGKRKRDESVEAASEVSVVNDSTTADVDDGGRPTSPSKNKRRKKKKKKGPITANESVSVQVALQGGTSATMDASRNGTSKVALDVDASGKAVKGKGKASDGGAGSRKPSNAEPLEDSMDKPKSSKGKEISSVAGPSTTKIEDLVDEDAGTSNKSIIVENEKQKTFMTSLSQSLVCQICLDPMFKPFTLAPCGHSACFSCLESWFRAPPPEMPGGNDNNDFDPQRPEFLALASATLLRKRKTCPHCRAHVSSKPMEAWNIKSIVMSLFSSGLGEDLYPGTSMPAHDPSATTAEREPWKGIFREELSALERIRAYEHAPMMDELGLGDAPQGELGIRDDEDGVYRCVDCLHEIWDGVCSHCDRVYPAHLDFGMDFFDGDEEIDLESLDGVAGFGHRELESDSEDDGYESSFIEDDDGGAARDVIDLTRNLGRNARNGGRRRTASVISISSGNGSDAREHDGSEDENEENDVEEVVDVDGDEDEEGEGEDMAPGPIRRGRPRRGPTAIVVSDEELEEHNTESEDEFPPRRRNRHIRPPSYDDEDEDDHSTGELSE